VIKPGTESRAGDGVVTFSHVGRAAWWAPCMSGFRKVFTDDRLLNDLSDRHRCDGACAADEDVGEAPQPPKLFDAP
jgi:hypothetical protein